jgi:FkbM family methyltransferase
MRSEPLVRRIGRLEAFWRRGYRGLMRLCGVSPYRTSAQGLTFIVGHKDLIDFRLAREGVWEAEQLNFISAHIDDRQFDVFLDIGANAGFYSLLFAKKKLAKEFIAFEPDPGNRARLLANLEANDLSEDIWVLDYALGNESGEATLTEGNAYNRGESYLAQEKMPAGETTHRVSVKRFDDEFSVKGKRIYMKMDVEGYEFFALLGMERTLRENSCFLQIEIFAEDPEKLKTMLTGFGYRYLGTAELDLFFSNITE